ADAAFDALGTAQAITDSTPTIRWDPNSPVADIVGYWAIQERVVFALTGVTLSSDCNPLGSCEVYLFKDNGDDTLTWLRHVVSASDGTFTFSTISDDDAAYLIVAWKDDTPHVFDCTDHNLTPVAE
ncbi:MAG: hypothetical protein MJA83_01805, partial [Gammaproteobacteria bacterium]|nr:hypothetical protein [Gammaproteobacteria bacterium]